MGVNWQNNDTYQSIRRSERESGISFAQQNALMNPNGVHSIWGVVGVSLFNGISQFCMQNAPAWAAAAQQSDGTDVSVTTDVLKDFTDLKNKFTNETDPTKKKEYAQQLQQLALENPDNKTIMNGYKTYKDNINSCLNS